MQSGVNCYRTSNSNFKAVNVYRTLQWNTVQTQLFSNRLQLKLAIRGILRIQNSEYRRFCIRSLRPCVNSRCYHSLYNFSISNFKCVSQLVFPYFSVYSSTLNGHSATSTVEYISETLEFSSYHLIVTQVAIYRLICYSATLNLLTALTYPTVDGLTTSRGYHLYEQSEFCYK